MSVLKEGFVQKKKAIGFLVSSTKCIYNQLPLSDTLLVTTLCCFYVLTEKKVRGE